MLGYLCDFSAFSASPFSRSSAFDFFTEFVILQFPAHVFFASSVFHFLLMYPQLGPDLFLGFFSSFCVQCGWPTKSIEAFSRTIDNKMKEHWSV